MIFFYHPRWQVGGVETTNSKWASILRSKGHEVVTLTFGVKNDVVLPNDVRRFSSALCVFWFVFHAALSMKASLVICQSYVHIKLLPVLWLLKLLSSCELILAERNSFEQYRGSKKYVLYKILFPFTLKVFDKIIFNSKEMQNEAVFFNIPRNKKFVVINPRFDEIDVRNILTKSANFCPSDGKVISMFCRWNDQKDTEFIQYIAPKIVSHGFKFQVFCGKTDKSYQYPFVDNALDYMLDNPSIIFFCSKFEGYPNVLVEARAAGLPIVYSECKTGVKEVLAGYEGAFQFNKSNYKTCIQALDKASLFALRKRELDYDFIMRHAASSCNLNTVFQNLCHTDTNII